MPEGHAIHRIARDHNRDFAGQSLIVTSPQGRFVLGARRINGETLERVEAHGKHLCYHWSGGQLLHIHLGLYGRFRNHRSPPPEPRGQVRLRIIGEGKSFDLNGPNRCELLTHEEWRLLRNRLGEDPLRDDGDPTVAWRKVQASRAAIGSLLLNQSILAGVGNIYRSEVLFLLRIHPATPAKYLSRGQFDDLWSELQRLLQIGVRYNRIIVAEPEAVGRPRSKMRREERLLIYKKQHCSSCGARVHSWELAARTVYACSRCQPHPRANREVARP
ncbi:Fpg/Nei family DNA glycosylase [Aeoliella sp. ICT_H6.2]|uniref:DNA-(apurinic or apyrimidinic site) lyase n=1 Tax=Aeoliella straminimaris TaxID=2954799 RepID=A0A9X2F899_9BACT|nr:DNA glycosylase [Aeoliella straminimaris]MCO6044180.1 Fpg/Nei family DNA glycosylase [Aeoliella straminimaris]